MYLKSSRKASIVKQLGFIQQYYLNAYSKAIPASGFSNPRALRVLGVEQHRWSRGDFKGGALGFYPNFQFFLTTVETLSACPHLGDFLIPPALRVENLFRANPLLKLNLAGFFNLIATER
jgi:hypothetical protein